MDLGPLEEALLGNSTVEELQIGLDESLVWFLSSKPALTQLPTEGTGFDPVCISVFTGSDWEYVMLVYTRPDLAQKLLEVDGPWSERRRYILEIDGHVVFHSAECSILLNFDPATGRGVTIPNCSGAVMMDPR